MKTHQLSIISQNNNSTIFQVGQEEYIMDSSEDEGQKKGRENYCYFCKQQNMNSCVNRSLYHKYSDVTDKEMRDIDKILKKDKFLLRYNYDEMQYDFNESEHLRENYDKTKTHLEMMELLEYYKYRKYVPIFSKSRSALSATQSIYYYYYERLKVYYNQIKKQLNMTLEDSSKSDSSSSKYSDTYSSKQNLSNLLSQNQLKDSCQPLPQLKSKESLRQFQTQSKALEDVLTLLKKNEQQLKRIKTLKTQDCYHDTEPRSLYKKKKNGKEQKISPFDDHEQRTTFFRTSEKPTISTSSNNSHLKLGNITKINKRLQKSNNQNVFYRYIQSIRNERVNDAQKQIKIRKKSIDQGKNSLGKKKSRGYQDENNQWVRDREEITSSRKRIIENDISKNLGIDSYRQENIPEFGSSSHRLLRDKSSSKKKSTKRLSDIYEEPQLSKIGRDHIRSLPKILMEFQNKPRRSMSSYPIKNSNFLINYHSNKVDSKILPLRRQIKQSPYKKIIKDQEDLSRSKSTQKMGENQRRTKNTNQIVRRSKSKKDYYEYKKQTNSKEKLVLKQPTQSLTKNTLKHEDIKQAHRTENDHNLKADLYRKINKQSMNTYQINTCTTNQQHRKSHQNSIQIEKDDNLASVRRKKLEELKIKSNRKKQ